MWIAAIFLSVYGKWSANAVGSADELFVVDDALSGKEDEYGFNHGQAVNEVNVALNDCQSDIPGKNEQDCYKAYFGL